MSASASLQYKAVNEPVYSYDKGSKERIELEETLKAYDCKVHNVPIVIGDEEICTKDVIGFSASLFHLSI